MVPCRPPSPTDRYLWFQFAVGSHTSKLICESDDGLATPATLQNPGTFVIGAGAPGGVNEPPALSDALRREMLPSIPDPSPNEFCSTVVLQFSSRASATPPSKPARK